MYIDGIIKYFYTDHIEPDALQAILDSKNENKLDHAFDKAQEALENYLIERDIVDRLDGDVDDVVNDFIDKLCTHFETCQEEMEDMYEVFTTKFNSEVEKVIEISKDKLKDNDNEIEL